MYYQIEQVLEQYDLGQAVVSKGRQMLLCETGDGPRALKIFNGRQANAQLLYDLGEFLYAQGMHTDGLMKTTEGELWAQGVDGVVYTLHRWYRGRECEAKNRGDVLRSVRALAGLHQTLRRFQPGEGLTCRLREDPLSEYERHNRELCQIRNFLRKKKKKNEFERLFLECFPFFFQQCRQAGLYLESAGNLPGMIGICHGDFNQHNIVSLSGNSGHAILNFERAGYGMQVSDLCNFMRKILEKHNWEEGLGMAMLREYEKGCPLTPGDRLQLYCRLSYPEKFWKIADRYYGSRKVWISGQNLEKLKKEIRQNDARCRYLGHLREILT